MERALLAERQQKFFDLRRRGKTLAAAAAEVGISRSTSHRWSAGQNLVFEDRVLVTRADAKLKGPLTYSELGPEAQKAYNDFSYFEERYFGVIPHPWQEEAANQILQYLQTPDKEYMVVNAPPGAGKTSLFTLRIPAWLTCRDRAIRGMIGSATKTLAKNNVSLLRREFGRTHPIQNPGEEVEKGLALDAVATMSQDFGRFKPIERDLWTADAFTVEQFSAKGPLSEKEPTWSAYGIDAEYTGLRYPFVLWDDLVSLMNQSTPEMREKIERLWMSVCENRLEPGGVLVLMGQRLLADDLYNFCKSMQVPADPDDETDYGDPDDPNFSQPLVDKYVQLIYKAHYEERCEKHFHQRGAPAWPEGCLLVPERLTWRDIRIAEAKPDYRTVYQQEDVNPEDVLVKREWIWGDTNHVGCLDHDRDMWELPRDLEGDFLAVVTCDPSPSNFWAVEYWLYHPDTDQRILLALHRRRMGAPDFLDFEDGRYMGLLQEWFDMGSALGVPFTHLIFEVNSSNKFILQASMFQKWRDRMGIEILSHTTGRNKTDPELGVWMLGPHYRFGRVRLPYKAGTLGRARTLDLVRELTTYSHTSTGKTDDCVMAHWFFEWNLQNIYTPARNRHRQHRPSWIKPKHASGRKFGLGNALGLPAGA